MLIIILAFKQNILRLQKPAEWDLSLLVYWLAMYGFCIAALVHLGIAAEKPLYYFAGILLGVGTLMIGAVKNEL